MRISNATRGSGKTTNLIMMSANTNTPIITHSHASKDYIIKKANEIGVVIPEPISISELKHDKSIILPKEVFIDELDLVLYALIKSNVLEATMTGQVVSDTSNETL